MLRWVVAAAAAVAMLLLLLLLLLLPVRGAPARPAIGSACTPYGGGGATS